MLINNAGNLYATKTDVNLPFRIQKQELSSFFTLLIKFKAGSMFHSVIPHPSPIPDTNPKVSYREPSDDVFPEQE